MLWLCGAGLVISVAMVILLVGGIAWNGLATFWPRPLVEYLLVGEDRVLGEVLREEVDPEAIHAGSSGFSGTGSSGTEHQTSSARRRLLRTDNFEFAATGAGGGERSRWIRDAEIIQESQPNWAVIVERAAEERLCGYPVRYAEVIPLSQDDLSWPRPSGLSRRQAAARQLQATMEPAETASLLWFVDRPDPGRIGSERRLLIEVEDVDSDSDLCLGIARRVRDGSEAAWRAYLDVRRVVDADVAIARSMRAKQLASVGARGERARLALRAVELRTQPDRGWVAARLALAEAEIAARDPDVEGPDAAVQVLRERLAELTRGLGPEHKPPAEYVAAVAQYVLDQRARRVEFHEVSAAIERMEARAGRHWIQFAVAAGAAGGDQTEWVRVSDIVRAYVPNQLSWFGKLGVYLSRWREFLSETPRAANLEGGVFPAIFGTVVMTLLMCLLVVPLGVLAALYLREYARRGWWVTSAVRIAITNLAGVPSIVFGVFGLGFFCHLLGVSIDELLFAERLPVRTFGKSGLLWASLTLALLTLPVVIVATEEALAAVPSTAREASYACGASRWQTIRRVVLPRAMPGILTGAILAMARGAGEVAPLLLVGAVKLAPELPISAEFPFGLDRSFMHLGFHIFDLGFQSPNADAARPMVYTTALVLITVIATLNLGAVWLRARLRRRFAVEEI